MLDQAGNPVIIDFGSSGQRDLKHGTVGYYAPEQQELTVLQPGMDLRKLDTWSLGHTLAKCFDDGADSFLTCDQAKKKVYSSNKLHYSVRNCSSTA